MWRLFSASVDLLVFIIWTQLKFLILFQQFNDIHFITWTAKQKSYYFLDQLLLVFIFWKPRSLDLSLGFWAWTWPSREAKEARSIGNEVDLLKRVFDILALSKWNFIKFYLCRSLANLGNMWLWIRYKLINLIWMGKLLCKVQGR